MDNLLATLRNYFKEARTKRQLNLEVPAGFRRDNELQRRFRDVSMASSSIPSLGDPTEDSSMDSFTLSKLSDTTSKDMISNSDTSASPTSSVPIIRCADKVSTSLPSRITLTEDYIRASVGFRRIDTLKKELQNLYKNSIVLDNLPPDAVLDMGDLATMKKTPRNTTPIPRPSNLGDVIHMDIVFGPDVSLGNIHYGLMFSDRATRMTFIYPLQNLTSDIP